MSHIRGLRDKITTKISKAVIDEGAVGDITIVINGTALDTQLTYLACVVGKEAKRKVSLIHVIEVLMNDNISSRYRILKMPMRKGSSRKVCDRSTQDTEVTGTFDDTS